MSTVELPWGADASLEIPIPSGWDTFTRGRPQPNCADVDIATTVRSCGLRQIARPPVTVVVDDLSRPTPAHLVLPHLIDELAAAGVAAADITGLVALGTHRPMSREEIAAKVGPEAAASIPWVNHDCRAGDALANLGTTSRGTPVVLHRLVTEAATVILVGCVEPHVQAGFGGGAKLLLPGVAGVEAIAANHLLSASEHHFWQVGNSPSDVPMRLDLEEAAAMVPAQLFALNFVLDAGLQPVALETGDPTAVHRACLAVSRRMYAVDLAHQADVVITSSYPLDLDLRQGVKCIANTLFAARDGGLIVAALRCREGVGSVNLPEADLPPPEVLRSALADLGDPELLALAEAIGTGTEDRFNAYFAMRALARNEVLVYAPALPEELARRTPTFRVFCDVDELMAEAAARAPAAAQVAVFPCGGVSYPVLGTGAPAGEESDERA
ncbi:MAG: hypothetical protein JJLCMIEE_01060 [Acidimicrobiales bacterium]|nr:MAG: nickel-dependent lactate racemase [Actinomycetota bacterium]MBV6508002.1 hypothetical protein [Acidimicrobiales bacterium]RIK06970.1 MAG: nickel-dependent lactate racemase [Acidobacteriota bacterium]